MSSKFFTNRDSNTLENRLKDIRSLHGGITTLEFLIGYFRISGFSKISSLLDNISSARILVGIDIDALTLEAKERGKKLNLLDFEKMTNKFVDEQLEKLNDEPYAKEVDESVELFARMLADKRIEIRISPDKNIHSKIYILREDEITRHDETVEQRGIGNDQAKSYYFSTNDRCEPVSFIKMAKHLKVSPRIKAVTPLKPLHYTQVLQAVETYENELQKLTQTVSSGKVDNVTDKKAIRLLKGWFDKDFIDKETYQIFLKIFKDGTLLNMGKKITNLAKKPAHEVVSELEKLQSEYSLQVEDTEQKRIKREIEVILSETFVSE